MPPGLCHVYLVLISILCNKSWKFDVSLWNKFMWNPRLITTWLFIEILWDFIFCSALLIFYLAFEYFLTWMPIPRKVAKLFTISFHYTGPKNKTYVFLWWNFQTPLSYVSLIFRYLIFHYFFFALTIWTAAFL